MFTGIVEAIGTIQNIEIDGSNIHFTLKCPFASSLKIDQSVAHNGCCLTVTKVMDDTYKVTAIDETLLKTNLGKWNIGTEVNIERCTQMGGRLDGHIVQGHIDKTGIAKSIEDKDGSHYITIEYHETDEYTTVPQGSITINGVSLTVAHSGKDQFSVAIIPYTWEHTNMHCLRPGDIVNLEFDIIGKYISKLLKKQFSQRPV